MKKYRFKKKKKLLIYKHFQREIVDHCLRNMPALLCLGGVLPPAAWHQCDWVCWELLESSAL